MILQANTLNGPVKGVKSVVEGLAEFRGIPYAKPPVGSRRWEKPEEPDYHAEELLCDTYGPCAMQPVRDESDFYRKEFYEHRFHRYPARMSEDCLYLNIWTPAESKEDHLPVYIWVHGGGFTQGYSHEPRTNGEVLASKGIVVVSFNYRLGIMGFFSHPGLSLRQNGHSGNYGIMDQIMAINWVYDNISEFGGDPQNITIGGQSAGSFSVEALCVSPLTKGKIKRAVMQSGVVTPAEEYGDFYKSLYYSEQQGLDFSEYTGHSLDELKDTPAEELMRMYAGFCKQRGTRFNYMTEDKCLFTENPLKSFLKGEEHIDELLIGATKEESQIAPFDESITKDNYQEKVKRNLSEEYQMLTELKPANDEEAKALYNTWFAWYQNNGSQGLAEIFSRQGKKVYSYSFERDLPGKDNPGAFHSACIWYSFGNLHNAIRPFEYGDFELERQMNGYWANFIKTGNPNGKDLPVWNAFDQEHLSIVFDEKSNHLKDISEGKDEWFGLRDKIVSRIKD